MKKSVNWKVLIFSLIIIYAIAFIGSLFTMGNTDSSWYNESKPSFTPPNFVFPIVWNILFFMIALSLYFAWTSAKKNYKKQIALVFGANLFFNVMWSYFFFKMQNPLIAFFDLLFILGTIIWMILLTKKINSLSWKLLIPYLLWVSFAGILNLGFII